MLDIKLVRENPELVKENIKKKFQNHKLVLVDEVIELDAEYRNIRKKADDLRGERNKASKNIGLLMREGKKEEAQAAKEAVANIGKEIADIEVREVELEKEIKDRMLVIPNIIDPSVPVGKDD